MKTTVRVRFWFEAGLASLCGFLAIAHPVLAGLDRGAHRLRS